MTPERRTVKLRDGTTVSLITWEPPKATARDVLLLHGGGIDNATLSWGELGPRLAEAGHRVYAPDHPGYGESPAASWPATQEALVRYVGDLTAAFGLRDHVIGGLSLGGGMTIGHLLAGSSARAAILLGSYGLTPRLVDGPFSGAAQLLTWMTERAGALRALTAWYAKSPKLLESSIADLVRDPARCTPELLEGVAAAARRPDAFAPFAQWQRSEVQWNRLRTDYSARLPEISVPVLVVHGDRDSGVPVARARAAAEALPYARLLVVDGAGHWVQRDRPDVVIPAVIDFVREVG